MTDGARAELAAEGLTEAEIEQLAPHKVIRNKPSNTMTMEKVTPETKAHSLPSTSIAPSYRG